MGSCSVKRLLSLKLQGGHRRTYTFLKRQDQQDGSSEQITLLHSEKFMTMPSQVFQRFYLVNLRINHVHAQKWPHSLHFDIPDTKQRISEYSFLRG